jgi:hypothetical protein
VAVPGLFGGVHGHAIRERDVLFLVSTLFFLAACLVFLVGRRSD